MQMRSQRGHKTRDDQVAKETAKQQRRVIAERGTASKGNDEFINKGDSRGRRGEIKNIGGRLIGRWKTDSSYNKNGTNQTSLPWIDVIPISS